MIGVTIGIGERHAQLAVKAGKAIQEYYGVDKILVLNDKHLEIYCPNANRFPDAIRRMFFLKFCIPLICDDNRWLYFDADYRVIKHPPSYWLESLRFSEKLLAVNDCWPQCPYPWPYHNAGFYVANRAAHEQLFAWCRANYFSVPEIFGEQCVWNRGIRELGVKVLELPYEFNARESVWTGPGDPIAKHGDWGGRSMSLTIAYCTARKQPHFKWFFDSLGRQHCRLPGIRLVVVDFHHAPDRLQFASINGNKIIHVPPKPNVWQGPHRLTQRDYFAASNARNTALCYAADGWISFVDDLSVLRDGWLAAVQDAMRSPGTIRLGAYRKVNELQVIEGEVKGFSNHPHGFDSRWNAGNDYAPAPIHGSAMFGCSLVGEVEAFMRINGFDEDCSPIGGEDYLAGLMLQAHGYKFVYDRRMLTYECETCHHREPRMAGEDKGVSPNDMSHRLLAMVNGGRNVAPNYFGESGIRKLRDEILAGGGFPIPNCPQHHWPDGQPLAEM